MRILPRTVIRSRGRSLTRFALSIALFCTVAALVPLLGIDLKSVYAIAAGNGSYTTTLPAGEQGPSDANGNPVTPKVTADFSKPPVTNDWWSSLIWHNYPDNPYSENLFPHPLALRARAGGLALDYPSTATISDNTREYHHHFTEDLLIGVAGLNSPDTRVADYGDWTVTAAWNGNGRSMRATFGRGLPFVYVTRSGDDATVSFNGTPSIWYNSGGIVGATINGQHYGIFGPTGSTWSGTSTLRSALNGQNYFSVAALPDATTTTLDFYRRHAYAFVADTRVDWAYDEASARLTTTFEATPVLKESGGDLHNHPLMALYPHHWQNSSVSLTGYSYSTPRGTMRVFDGNRFSTVMTFHGVLPNLPDQGTYDRNRLYGYVDSAYQAGNLFPTGGDTYWTGKALGRVAMLVRIADQVGHTAARDHFLNALKGKLEQWLDSDSGQPLFYYDSTWKTLIGYPAAYGSDTQLNDHHFHYAYFIRAAATVAQYDPTWAADSNWGGMVELLIRDPASGDRADGMFPFLRNFDPYVGHAWASGPAQFASGNNQESSSESINFSAALVLWGATTGDTAVRDLGIFLYTNEVAAIQQYWFDVDETIFPDGYQHETLGMLWGSGGSYSTWWTANPEEIHGINFLPITAGSLYLGYRTDYIARNYNHLVTMNGGEETEWRDIIWSFQALADPGTVVNKFEANAGYTPEAGESKAHTYHWIHNLNGMGQVDTSVTANIPTYSVFNNAGTRTYVAYNPYNTDITVSFSDGAGLHVPARSLAAGDGSDEGGSPPGGGLPSPWENGDIGAVGVAGSAQYDNGTFTIDGGGADIWNAADEFHYAYQSLSGDGEIVARVASIEYTHDWAKAGVMIRETLAADSRHAYMAITPGNGLAFQRRTSTGGTSAHTSGGAASTPYWVRLVRSGSTFTGYASSDGTNWTEIGSTTIDMGSTVYVGLAVTSHDDSTLATATFDSVSVTTSSGGSFSGALYVLTGGSLSTTPGGGATNDTIPSAGGNNYDGTPHNPVIYTITGVNGTFTNGSTAFNLFVDAGTSVGNGPQAQVLYDFTGDGTFDRTETYNYFPTNDLVGWEEYTQARGVKETLGSFAGSMQNGTVQIKVWNAIGNAPTDLRVSATDSEGLQSMVTVPYQQ